MDLKNRLKYKHWPLKEGFERLQTVAIPQVTRAARFKNEKHMITKSVEIVMNYCKESTRSLQPWVRCSLYARSWFF
jgi:hypothetical protein